jgi:N-acetylmuramoyl-L-alanine amidase
VRTIVLDPGHGGSETGTRGTRGVFEKVLTLDLALRLQRELQARGFQASLTRTSDRTLSLERRTDLAQARRADLFVSLHLNSGGTASGVETYALTPGGAVSTSTTFRGWGRNDDTDAGNRTDEQNTWLAHCVQDSLLRATGALDRGVRRARFMVLRTAPCPAVLVEAGFLSNAGEEKKLLEADYRDKLAKAMAEGIAKYRAGVERK